MTQQALLRLNFSFINCFLIMQTSKKIIKGRPQTSRSLKIIVGIEPLTSLSLSNLGNLNHHHRTCLEIVLSIGLFLIYWCWGMPNLEREIDCDVHGLQHKCVLPNHQVSFDA